MPRRLPGFALNGLCLLSLSACLATAALWAWSDFARAPAVFDHRKYATGEWVVGARAGEAFFREEPYPQVFVISTLVDGVQVPPVGPVPVMGNSSIPARSDVRRPFPGVTRTEEFFSIPMSYGPPSRQPLSREVAVRLWLPCLLSAAPPALWAARRIRRRKRRPGCCPACGYDLTGNVSGRCPECGTPRPAAAPRGVPVA